MSARIRYMKMFQSPSFGREAIKNKIERIIPDAIREGAKDDRIIFLLKALKYDCLNDAEETYGLITKKESAWRKRYERDNLHGGFELYQSKGSFCGMLYEHMKESVETLNTSDPDSFKNYYFGNKTPAIICKEISILVAKSRDGKRNKVKAVAEYGEKIIRVDDDYFWFDLQRPTCSIEAAAMMHCGAGFEERTDNIYSLRRRSKAYPGKWEPCITAIVNKENGKLAEMKGRGNKKPSKKYHSAIIQFLLHDRIKEIVGGGSKQETNFFLSDLSIENLDIIIKNKPELLGPLDAWLAKGKVFDHDVMNSFFRLPGININNNIEADQWKNEPHIILDKVESVCQLASEKMDVPNLKNIMKILKISKGMPCDINIGIFKDSYRLFAESTIYFMENCKNKEHEDYINKSLLRSAEVSEEKIDWSNRNKLFEAIAFSSISSCFLRAFSAGVMCVDLRSDIEKKIKENIKNWEVKNGLFLVENEDCDLEVRINPISFLLNLHEFYERTGENKVSYTKIWNEIRYSGLSHDGESLDIERYVIEPKNFSQKAFSKVLQEAIDKRIASGL